MKPSRKDVANLAGVSPTTVSRVINDRGYISKKTREQVETAMKNLGYYPNEIARSLSRSKSGFIGLIFPSLTNPFQVELINHIECILSKRGYKVLICNSNNNSKNEIKYLEMLKRNQVDGIIVNSLNESLNKYIDADLHIVSIDRKIDDTIPLISCDNYNGAKLAIQRLINKHCINILFIGNQEKNIRMDADKRHQAYKDLCTENNLKTYTLPIDFTLSYEKKCNIIKNFFDSHPYIDGIFTDDSSAIAALNTAKDMGKNISEDLKIIGFDGASITKEFLPNLTTIEQPISLLAKISVDTLFSVMNNNEGYNTTNLPVTLKPGLSG